jgi:type I restriction enzyme, R subunit
VLVISDGIAARIGSLTADRERFMPWRTVAGDGPRLDFSRRPAPLDESIIMGLNCTFDPRSVAPRATAPSSWVAKW